MWSVSRFQLGFWLLIASTTFPASASGPTAPTLRLEVIPELGVEGEAAAERDLLDVSVDPRGRGFLALTRDQRIVALGWDGNVSTESALHTRGGDFGLPMGLFTQPEGIAVDQAKLRRTAFFDARLRLVTAVSWSRAGCAQGSIRLADDRIFCLGAPVVPPADTSPRWDDSNWRRRHLRRDCGLFLIDPGSPEAQRPAFCDERFDSPLGRGLPGGHALASLDGKRVYATFEAVPELVVLDAAGETVRRSTWLADEDSFPNPTPAEIDAQYDSADAALAFRNRFDWPMGLLRWGDDESRETHAVAIVFRRWTGDRPIFVADIFSAQGEKLGDDLPLVDPDTPRLEASAFVSAASASDGRAFLLVGNRRSGDRRLLSQRLYEVVLDGLDTDGRSLRVSVRDDRGSLPDARVIDVEAREAFLTDADGVARLIDRPTTPFALEVRADDHIRRELWVQPEECHLDVELDRGSGFRIRLLDPLGASLDAVRVRPRQGGHFHTVERRLDADGAVEVAGLQAGDAELTFLVDGYRTARLNVDLPVAGEVVDLGDLVLDPGGVVEGRLTLEDGTPLADAVAVAHRPSRSGRLGAEYHGDLLTASCDADGRFRLGGLDPGDTCIRIDHPSTPPRALAISTLGENEQRDLGTITIGPAIHLHGRVEDSADQPLEGESVELRAGDADDPCQRLTTVTDTQGRFAFDAVGFGAWTAVVRRDGQVVARRTLTLDDETDPVADLGTLTVAERRLAGAVRIGGLHAAGGGLSIEPRRATAAPTPLFVTEHGTQRLINDRPIALGTPVDGDGSFSLTGVLPAGPAVVTYRTPTGDAFRHIVHLPSVEKGQASTDRLDLDFDGIELRGIAQLVDGRPAVGARLILHLDDLAVRETATDAAGRFRLASAPPRGRLVAHLDALVGEATVGPDRRVEIELRPTAYR